MLSESYRSHEIAPTPWLRVDYFHIYQCKVDKTLCFKMTDILSLCDGNRFGHGFIWRDDIFSIFNRPTSNPLGSFWLKGSVFLLDIPLIMGSYYATSNLIIQKCTYEGCSNMNASSFITFFTYMLWQNVILFWKELYVAFKMTPNIKKHSLYVSSYIPLYKGHSCILKFFWSKLKCTFWYMCGYSVISL